MIINKINILIYVNILMTKIDFKLYLKLYFKLYIYLK